MKVFTVLYFVGLILIASGSALHWKDASVGIVLVGGGIIAYGVIRGIGGGPTGDDHP